MNFSYLKHDLSFENDNWSFRVQQNCRRYSSDVPVFTLPDATPRSGRASNNKKLPDCFVLFLGSSHFWLLVFFLLFDFSSCLFPLELLILTFLLNYFWCMSGELNLVCRKRLKRIRTGRLDSVNLRAHKDCS